ncbi:MAG: CNP1-like family protein [Betaproteobacteria bacterium]
MKRLWLVAMGLVCAGAQAQLLGDSNWQEAAVAPPPAFSLDRLLRFEVNPNSTFVYAVDPQTVTVSAEDRVVRYVMVATSPSGVRNVFYEGIRCPTSQVKTYARHSDGRWAMASDPQWQNMALRSSLHALELARQGACDGAGTPSSAADILRRLRSGISSFGR